MKKITGFMFLFFAFISPTTFSKEFNDATFSHELLIGHWIGLWDDIYDVKFTVLRKKEQYAIIYEWKENQKSDFKRKQWEGISVNMNTIDFHTISLRIDPHDKNKALAFGKFNQRTRIAFLIRKDESLNDENKTR